MEDYRSKLYAEYITKFKTSELLSNTTKEKWYNYKILPLLGNNKKAEVLEIGCGKGELLNYLYDLGYHNVRGIDISPEQISIAQNHYQFDIICVDVFNYLSTLRKSFNVIIAIDVLEHFSKDELFKLMPMINKALSDGGTLIIQTPNGMGLFPNQVIYGDLTHQTVLNPFSLEQLLQIFGFSNILFFESGPVPKGFKGIIKFIFWSVIKLIPRFIRKIETGKSQSIWTENMICSCSKIN